MTHLWCEVLAPDLRCPGCGYVESVRDLVVRGRVDLPICDAQSVVSPNEPATLPDGWTHVAAPFVRAEDLPAVVPGLDGRLAYVSGPPTMVSTVSSELRKHVSGVRTDHFSGY